MNNKISIITVVYNGVDTLEKTIQSVIQLNRPDVNYIIIDGGSSDGTVDIIQKYESHITYWLTEKDKGIYDAMNKGWQKARDDHYILFLGSGDQIISLPDFPERYKDKVIYGDVRVTEDRVFKSVADFRLRMGNTLHHQALLVKKAFHPTPPFSLDYKVYADFDFNQRLLNNGVEFVHDSGFVAYALPGGVSQKFNYKEALRIVIRNQGLGWAGLAIVYYLLLFVKWNILRNDR